MGRSKTYTFNGVKYTITENRARPSEFGGQYIADADDPRLATVPGTWGTRKLHWIAAQSFNQLRAAALADGHDLRLNNGWRPKEWPTLEAYEEWALKHYASLKAARNSKSYLGAHHVGLAMDLGKSAGFSPEFGSGRTKQRAMRELKAFEWMVINAARFGWTPLLGVPTKKDPWWYEEPWHWERKITKRQLLSLPDGTVLAEIDLETRRAGAYAGVSRRDYFQGGRAAWDARNRVQGARDLPMQGVFVKDEFNTDGLLFDFQNGRWVDGA